MWAIGINELWEFGGVGLAARSLDAFPDGAYVTNLLLPPFATRVVWPPGTVLSDEYFWGGAPRTTPHFPYGNAVEPDVHT